MTGTPPAPAPDMAAWPPLDPHRGPAGADLLSWASSTEPDLPRLCLIRGGRSSGKSRLLAWFLAGSTAHPHTTAHAAVPCEGLLAASVAWEMSRQLGYGPLPPGRLLDRVAGDRRPLLLLLPDLHLAGEDHLGQRPSEARSAIEQLLTPLLELPEVRVVAETGSDSPLDARAHHTVDLGPASHPDASPPPNPAADFATLLATVPRTAGGRPDWSQAPRATRDGILHAALATGDAGTPGVLLTDPGFLVNGPATATAAALAHPSTPAPAGLRTVWERAAPQLSDPEHSETERAALLHAAALETSPALSEFLRPLAERHHWTAAWAQHGIATATHALLPGTPGAVVSADPLGRLHTHDPATGAPVGALPTPATSRPHGVAAPGPATLMLLDENGTLQARVPDEDTTAAAVLGHIAAHHSRAALGDGSAAPTALAGCPQSGLLVVGDEAGFVHVWPADAYRPLPCSRRLHEAPVTAVACLRPAGEELTLVVSAAFDGSIRLWETSQEPMTAPVEQRPALVTALAAASTPAGPLLAAAWNDAGIHLWNIATGRVRVLPLLHRCRSLTLTSAGELTLGGPDGLHTLRLDLERLWN